MDIKKKQLKARYTKNKRSCKKKENLYKIIFQFLMCIIVFLTLFSLILWTILYKKYILDLPSIKELENLEIAESSTIYDRNWNELYKIFKEKRTYVPYEQINKKMINAIVAWEDKRYWENPWVDIIWIIRAWLYYAIWKNKKIEWTSTITQQLIRNTIIANEKKIERKVKEIYLAYKLWAWISKEKILELYLNKISFWSNAYGIEQASQTFFWEKASELWILESSILASLPKWPTYYSPYSHPDRILGYPYVYNKEDSKKSKNIIIEKGLMLNKAMVVKLKDLIISLKAKRLSESKLIICNLKKEDFKNTISIDNDWCNIFDYSNLLSFLNSIRIEWKDQFIEYQTWRKDFILWRMLEDGYISFEEYKDAIINSFAYNFKQPKEKIETPHFVFFVKEYLEKKYWKELIQVWWLKIYTTLDLKLQKKAEEIVKNGVEKNKVNFAATNGALVSIDNKNWDILAMVWAVDYFDKEIWWNNNMVTSLLQPWSTFKPFTYYLAIERNSIWTKTPVYDLETKFPWWYIPRNFDWKFEWKMNISEALNYSRNIPAIKMFYLAWWEKNIVSFMKKLWVKYLKENWSYWVPLALWTWEMTPLELAAAYSVFANAWKKVEINPIMKILDSKWLLIEEKKEVRKEEVIDATTAYIINHILSDTSSRPESWNNYLSLNWRKVAAKTWTSTKQYVKWWIKQIFPSNMWTAWYTPQITTVVWSGNTDWKQLWIKGNWLEWGWTMWKQFMEFAHKWKNIENWSIPSWVRKINISEISWLLPSPENPNDLFIADSLFKNPPKLYDNSSLKVKVDALCDWHITDKTPELAIKEVSILKFNSLKPGNKNWEDPVKQWIKQWKYEEEIWNIKNVVTKINTSCERPWKPSKIEIASSINNWDVLFVWWNYVELAYRSEKPIIKLDILLWNQKVWEIKIKNKKSWIYKWSINIPRSYSWKNILKIRAVSSMYYSNEESKEIIIEKKKIPPKIKIKNPIDYNIRLYEWQSFNLRWEVLDKTPIKSINIYMDSKPLKIWIKQKDFVYSINSENLEVWNHKIKIEAIDANFNIASEEVNLEIIEN